MNDDLTSGQYKVISPEDLADLRRRAKHTLKQFPGAAFVGGTALRIWCDYLGIPTPAEFGQDTDITIPGAQKYQNYQNTPAGWIDIFPIRVPMVEPFFTAIIYNGTHVRLATLQYLLVRKISSMRDGIDERSNIMAKDLVYYDLLKRMVKAEELNVVIEALQSDLKEQVLRGDMAQAESRIVDFRSRGRISQEVHPERA